MSHSRNDRNAAINRLRGRLFTARGGLGGILSQSAAELLEALADDGRSRALELLFALVEPEGQRHTRRRIPYERAVEKAGGGDAGRALVDHLAGRRHLNLGAAKGPLRLITITENAGDVARGSDGDRWVQLIHETLVRTKAVDAGGEAQPHWPMLWHYLQEHQDRAEWRAGQH